MSTTTGVECPSCEAVGKLVLISPDYDGRTLAGSAVPSSTSPIRGGQVTSAVPTTREEVDRASPR